MQSSQNWIVIKLGSQMFGGHILKNIFKNWNLSAKFFGVPIKIWETHIRGEAKSISPSHPLKIAKWGRTNPEKLNKQHLGYILGI